MGRSHAVFLTEAPDVKMMDRDDTGNRLEFLENSGRRNVGRCAAKKDMTRPEHLRAQYQHANTFKLTHKCMVRGTNSKELHCKIL